MQAEILNAGAGHALPLGDVQMVVKEDRTHTRETLGLAECIVPPQGRTTPLPHIHHAHEEGLDVLEGELEVAVGTQTVRAGHLRDSAHGGRAYLPQSGGAARAVPRPHDASAHVSTPLRN